ncbi:hypothetical protein BUALT_Bualt18G0133400 [Buddleja alternifolia]|uniref:Uncharacterized protein n=1 Tax=Buddleja alternifolia TaxID=168488 RepID=A0AAV6WFK3_9LAMI|nr:hypothetical protein BUALT_Bualt18G0133400 [Buddleja alternifolia]
MENGFPGKKKVDRFTKLEERKQHLIDKERSVLLEVMNVIERATPLLTRSIDLKWQMGDISLLKDAVSQLDEPFLLVIVAILRLKTYPLIPEYED